MRGLSAGAIVTDGTSILLGHSTGNKHWDIPKGMVEPGESPVAACVRELHEETGLAIDATALTDLGRRPYTKEKDLHLFRVDLERLPDLDLLKCSSTFHDRWTGVSRPELDRFAHVPFADLGRYTTPTMGAALRAALNLG
jgi:8-oxo-dGTP pyrophosphatase MutT (NUDIX family)